MANQSNEINLASDFELLEMPTRSHQIPVHHQHHFLADAKNADCRRREINDFLINYSNHYQNCTIPLVITVAQVLRWYIVDGDYKDMDPTKSYVKSRTDVIVFLIGKMNDTLERARQGMQNDADLELALYQVCHSNQGEPHCIEYNWFRISCLEINLKRILALLRKGEITRVQNSHPALNELRQARHYISVVVQERDDALLTNANLNNEINEMRNELNRQAQRLSVLQEQMMPINNDEKVAVLLEQQAQSLMKRFEICVTGMKENHDNQVAEMKDRFTSQIIRLTELVEMTNKANESLSSDKTQLLSRLKVAESQIADLEQENRRIDIEYNSHAILNTNQGHRFF